MKRILLIIGLLLCMTMGGFLLLRPSQPALPLDAETVETITFKVYEHPTQVSNFTVRDRDTIARIVSAMNQVTLGEEMSRWPDPMSAQYYLLEFAIDGEYTQTSLDEQSIDLGWADQCYQADCSALCDLLYQICTDTLPAYSYEHHHQYAIEYLGYNVDLVEDFVPDDLPLFSTGGDEYYKITPRYTQMAVEIYQLVLDETAEDFTRRELIYSSRSATPFYIKGNQSDIFPNICVVLTTPEGERVEITPYVSLKDGSIVVGDEGYLVE